MEITKLIITLECQLELIESELFRLKMEFLEEEGACAGTHNKNKTYLLGRKHTYVSILDMLTKDKEEE